MEEKV